MPKLAPHRLAISDARTRKMRAILAACKRLGLDQDARREVQLHITGAVSMSAMDERQLGQLLDHLNRDFQGGNPQRPHLAKVKALWWSLYWLGAIAEPGDQALSAFVTRQTGIAALRFLDHRHAPSVIEALKSWLAREDVRWQSDAAIERMRKLGDRRGRAEWDRWAVIDALRKRLRAMNAFEAGGDGYAAAALKIEGNPSSWTARDLDRIIRFYGKLWLARKP